MPYYRKKQSKLTRRRPKRTYRRRYKRSKGTIARVPNTNVFPRRLITRLKYSDQRTLAISGGLGMTTDQYNMNGLYDPYAGSGGHQPYNFDAVSALYSRNRVYKCSWRITVAPSTQVFVMSVYPQNGSGNPTGDTQSTMAERPMAITKMTSSGSVPLVFKGTSYLPKLNGVKSSEYKDDDRFLGYNSANPAEVMLLTLGASSDTNCTVNYSITLIYYAEFLDPNIQDQS